MQRVFFGGFLNPENVGFPIHRAIYIVHREESGGAPPHSKTSRRKSDLIARASVLECVRCCAALAAVVQRERPVVPVEGIGFEHALKKEKVASPTINNSLYIVLTSGLAARVLGLAG